MNAKKRKDDELGPDSAGQSGDIQQLSDTADADSESVEELAEEGNAFEADAVEGVEGAQPPDVSEVKTREVPEDDVPEEYLDND
jgi:N utilization substance protein A